MKTNYSAYVGADIFDGDKMFDDHALLVRGDSIVGIVARTEIPAEAKIAVSNHRRGVNTFLMFFSELRNCHPPRDLGRNLKSLERQ